MSDICKVCTDTCHCILDAIHFCLLICQSCQRYVNFIDLYKEPTLFFTDYLYHFWEFSISLLQASQVVLVVKNPPSNAGDLRDKGSKKKKKRTKLMQEIVDKLKQKMVPQRWGTSGPSMAQYPTKYCIWKCRKNCFSVHVRFHSMD